MALFPPVSIPPCSSPSLHVKIKPEHGVFFHPGSQTPLPFFLFRANSECSGSIYTVGKSLGSGQKEASSASPADFSPGTSLRADSHLETQGYHDPGLRMFGDPQEPSTVFPVSPKTADQTLDFPHLGSDLSSHQRSFGFSSRTQCLLRGSGSDHNHALAGSSRDQPPFPASKAFLPDTDIQRVGRSRGFRAREQIPSPSG